MTGTLAYVNYIAIGLGLQYADNLGFSTRVEDMDVLKRVIFVNLSQKFQIDEYL